MVHPITGPIKKPITSTGVKGFLEWYKREQPAIYNKIAPQLPHVAPKAFSNYNQMQRRLGCVYQGSYKNRGVSGFGDFFDSPQYDSSPAFELTTEPPAIGPIDVGTINVGSSYQQPIFSADTGSYWSPVAQAANTSISSAPTIAAIGQVIGAASQIYMNNSQANLQQNVLNTQLQRAAQGLPPLNTSLAQLGVPIVSGGNLGSLGNSGMLLLLAGGVALVALMGKK